MLAPTGTGCVEQADQFPERTDLSYIETRSASLRFQILVLSSLEPHDENNDLQARHVLGVHVFNGPVIGNAGVSNRFSPWLS